MSFSYTCAFCVHYRRLPVSSITLSLNPLATFSSYSYSENASNVGNVGSGSYRRLPSIGLTSRSGCVDVLMPGAHACIAAHVRIPVSAFLRNSIGSAAVAPIVMSVCLHWREMNIGGALPGGGQSSYSQLSELFGDPCRVAMEMAQGWLPTR
jgi:hypothetical protein